jgi:imidazolonepropionase
VKPPVDALRAHGVSIALATDCNPGTSPVLTLPTAMNLGCVLFGLTPEEALAAVTPQRSARARLGRSRRTACRRSLRPRVVERRLLRGPNDPYSPGYREG